MSASSSGENLSRARARLGHLVKIEVEVDTLVELREALDAGVDVVLLDNICLLYTSPSPRD